MKKFKKYGLFLFIFTAMLLVFSFNASATSEEELYKRQYESSGVDGLSSALPSEVEKQLDDLGFELSNPANTVDFKGENLFTIISIFLKEGISAPLKTALSVIGILLIFASFSGIMENSPSEEMTVFVCFFSALIATAPVYSVMEGVQTAVQGLSTFMLSFVPVYASIMLSAGSGAAAGGFSTLLLSASEVISYLISYLFVPLSSAVMCLGICGGISPVAGISRLSEWIKKTANWTMGIATALFLGILSLQNTFAAAADGLGIRTSKAMLSTTIPIMGPAIAETVNTARGCLELLRSGTGIYAVVALILLALPTIIQLFLWRVSMWVTAGVAEIFGMRQVEKLLRSVDFCLSVLLSSVLFTTILFIISLAIGTGAG